MRQNTVGEVLEKQRHDDAIETSDSDIPQDLDGKRELLLTEREQVIERFADTPMAYTTKGVTYKANGSYEVMSLCVFMQNEKLPARFLEIKFQEAADLYLSSPEDLPTENSEDEEVTESVDGDSTSTENKPNEASGDIIKPEEPVKPSTQVSTGAKVNTATVAVDEPMTQYDSSQTKSLLNMVETESNLDKPDTPETSEPIDIELSDQQLEYRVIEPLDEQSKPNHKIELATPLLVTLEIELSEIIDEVAIEDKIDATVAEIEDFQSPHEIVAENVAATFPPPEQEITLPTPVVIENVHDTRQAIIEPTPILDIEDSLDNSGDELIDLAVLPDVIIPGDNSDIQVAHRNVEEEITVDEVNELLVGLSSEIAVASEPMLDQEERGATKIEQLYKCLDAQVHILSDIENEDLTDTMKVDAMHNTLVAILEEAEVTDPDLAAKLYLEKYGMSGLLDISKQPRSPATKVSRKFAEQCRKVARFTTTLLVRLEKSTS